MYVMNEILGIFVHKEKTQKKVKNENIRFDQCFCNIFKIRINEYTRS